MKKVIRARCDRKVRPSERCIVKLGIEGAGGTLRPTDMAFSPQPFGNVV